MTINKGSRRAKGESWLARAAARLRKAMKQASVVDAPGSKSTCQGSLYSDEADQAEATVLLKTGETVKVKAPDIERFLLENRGKIQSRKSGRRGKPRESFSGSTNQ